MKKILIILNNFYPEVSSLAQLYTDLCEELSNQYDVSVVCAVPSYTGEIDEKYKDKKKKYFIGKYKRIKVYRIRVSEFDKKSKASRIKSHSGYLIRAFQVATAIKDISLVLAVSQPPVIGGVLGCWYSIVHRCPLIYNIQDYNPEQIEAVGYSKNRLLIHVLRKIDKITCRFAKCIIVVSEEMVETLNRRFNSINVTRCVSVNNWVDENKILPLEHDHKNVNEFRERYHLKNKMVFMYSGNIGLIYDLENIVKVFLRFKNNPDIVFVFVGQGALKSKLEELVVNEGADNVIFVPYQKNEDLIYSLNAADVHFVLSSKGMKGVASPSKLYGIMAVGKPTIAMLEKGMEAHTIIQKSGCGIALEPEQYDELEETIKDFCNDSNRLIEMGNRARSYYCKYMGRDRSISGYLSIIKNILEKAE